MNIPDIRHRHSAPIAAHVPPKTQQPASGRDKSARFTSSQIAGDPMARASYRTHLRWAASGFILGIVFWHLVGFWSFVGDIILTGSSNSSTLMSRIQPTRFEQTSSRAQNASVPQTGGIHGAVTSSDLMNSTNLLACTRLILDREKRKTYSAPCFDRQQNENMASKRVQTASSHARPE